MSTCKDDECFFMNGVECLRFNIISNNTFEYYRKNGERVIRLFDTDLLTYHTDGSITICANGDRTFSARELVNHYIETGSMVEKNNAWWFYTGNGYIWENIAFGKKYRYADGMRIDLHGNVSGATLIKE